VGKDGREFVMCKFRTMHPDAPVRLAELRHLNDYDDVLFKLRDDPRLTRDLPFEEAVKLDLRYVENWSFSLDLMILLRTLSAVCRPSGAY
jgi:lipopolysaccharide/colanic/teichoic acid biosynthesis glycosyltransferase